jgi:hypothetical protein
MRIHASSACSRRCGWYFVSALMALFCAGNESSISAADKDAKPVAKLAADPVILLRHTGTDKPWEILRKGGESILTDDTILGGFGATLDSSDGAVRLSMPGDVNGLSPFPIVETVLTFHAAGAADLALTMDRGRIDLSNIKKSGSAKIKLTIQGKTGEIVLQEPGTLLSIEIYGRWPKGVRFQKNPKKDHAPTTALLFVVSKGEAVLQGPKRSFTLKAPPGPALVLVQNLGDESIEVESIKEVPAWIDAKDSEMSLKARAAVTKLLDEAVKKSLPEALEAFVLSEDPVERRVAVFTLAAIDDIPRLTAAMAATKHLDVWDNAVIALRNWIGRGPGQDAKLYMGMLEKKFSPGEAESVMQLLHSFGKKDLEKAETYEALIDYLDSDRLALRGLAYWHLSRLVPEGKKIGYNPLAPKEERAKAIEEWKKLIPTGTVPGHLKTKD